MLLDCRKGSISFFSSWWFHGARFSGCPKEDVWQQWALRQPPLPPPHGHSGVGGAGWAAGDHAERREFSGLLPSVLVSLTVSVRRAAGRSPGPFSLPPLGMGITETFLRAREFLSCLLLFLNKNQSIHRESHCLRFLQLATAQSSPAPRPVGSKPRSQLLLFEVALFHLPLPTPPQFSGRAQDSVGLFSFLTAVVAQSLSLSPQSLQLEAALANQCLTLA